MAVLEDLTRGSTLRGIVPNSLVTVIDVTWHGVAAITLTYKDSAGRVNQDLVFRDREASIEIVDSEQPWSFDADAEKLRLVTEAHRIRLAYLFDPRLAVHTSLVEPLPHQITAVYSEMLQRQPLRFLLADDPGAGKTIMAGLLIKELLVRGDVQRCLIVCPGSLVEQWQDELKQRFHLPFEILTNDKLQTAHSGNWFAETPFAICRLDKLSRNENVQAKLEQIDWDLIICDEAHKMSASFFGGEARYTKRYHLGQRLSRAARHFVLLTATPHNGKEEDFQLFMALLDADRFEGRFRNGVHATDTSDLMRRLVKEQLLKFDGTPLFPERRAYTLSYRLSTLEELLYEEVTSYVRNEFNRADALENAGRKGTVGFALTTLQRRLASSPEAIYQSLKRRRERLQKRIDEVASEDRLLRLMSEPALDLEEDDWDDAPDAELEELEQELIDRATAATTVAELEAEIAILAELEQVALRVVCSGEDRKWAQLSDLIQNTPEMFDGAGHRRKLVIFTEHRDTLNYLTARIRTLIGRSESVVTIHGGVQRDDRRRAQEEFTQNPDVQVLIATDAAGEGINLQRAHLMVNYDLPWNPNRLEQRFGRIHRIGQTEVCHLWNLVASETREGEVYTRLLRKLDAERSSLQGQVFDVLGKVTFGNRPLRELLIEAIRYGERPEVRARLTQVVDEALDTENLRHLIEQRALATDAMDASMVQQVRADMERAEAQRLQPFVIAAFFLEAFRLLGGTVREREPQRYEITNVPSQIRHHAQTAGTREIVLQRYERIVFDKKLIVVPGKPQAAFICPGHPLLEATIDLIVQRYRELLRSGAVLVDPQDPGEEVRILSFIEHAIKDARIDRSGQQTIVSRQMQFVEIDSRGRTSTAGPAPHLNYRPLTDDEQAIVAPVVQEYIRTHNLEREALSYAIQELVPVHFNEVRQRKEDLVSRTVAAVHDRLTKEIMYWDRRANELRALELAGRTPKINAARARQRADELDQRLKRRLEDLEGERQLSPLPPNIVGAALIVPAGLLHRLQGQRPTEPALFARETRRVEQLSMRAVMEAEQRLGNIPRDVSAENRGYDIESAAPSGALRFIEVKGRVRGADTVTITRNEIHVALNRPDTWILALVEVPTSEEFGSVDVHRLAERQSTYASTADCRICYVYRPFFREPDFGVTSVNYVLSDLWERGVLL